MTTISSQPAARAGERAYAVLKDRLLEGVYGTGQRLGPDDLAAELGVSRQPVFDALKRLSAEGFIDITPQVGSRVVSYDAAEVRDFFELFSAVEGAATAMAAQRRSDDDLGALRRISAEIGALVRLDSASERAHGYRVLNRDFHSTIHRCCGTPIVEAIGSGMYDRADFFINGAAAVSPLADTIAERHADHQRILAALADGDPDAARAAAADHILGTIPLIEAAPAKEGRSRRGGG